MVNVAGNRWYNNALGQPLNLTIETELDGESFGE